MLTFDNHSVSYHASQGPSFPPTGKGSQVAKKNLSNMVAAKTIKVQIVLLMPHTLSCGYGTFLIEVFCLSMTNLFVSRLELY